MLMCAVSWRARLFSTYVLPSSGSHQGRPCRPSGNRLSAQRTAALCRHYERAAPSPDCLRPPAAFARAPSAPSICSLACRPGAIWPSSRSLQQLAGWFFNLADGVGDSACDHQPADHSLHATGSQRRVRAPAPQPASRRHPQRGLRGVAGIATGQRRRALGTHPHRRGDGQDPGKATTRHGHRPGASGRRLALGFRAVHRQPDAASRARSSCPGRPARTCRRTLPGPLLSSGRRTAAAAAPSSGETRPPGRFSPPIWC